MTGNKTGLTAALFISIFLASCMNVEPELVDIVLVPEKPELLAVQEKQVVKKETGRATICRIHTW
ncbi:MAG TPA: hypothetical protein PKE30_10935 [Niabella sp.]|nr:hypothetical protein [Niabella sp.]